MTEYGLFSDEGLVEDGFFSAAEAEEARDTRYDPEDGLGVEEICREHPEQPRYGCEECAAEEQEEDEEDGGDEEDE